MTIKEQINADFMTAFKAGEKEKKTFLGTLKAEIARIESNPVEAKKYATNEDLVLFVVKKMEKSLKESNEVTELTYIESYLPKLMSEEEIRVNIHQVIMDSGETNMGKIMGLFNKAYAGQAFDNKEVARLIKVELA